MDKGPGGKTETGKSVVHTVPPHGAGHKGLCKEVFLAYNQLGKGALPTCSKYIILIFYLF